MMNSSPQPSIAPVPLQVAPLPDTMYAARFYKPGVVQYEVIAVPSVGPGELLVAIHTALTCGTDVKCFRRGHPVLLKEFPSPFGHEGAGIVVQVGQGVEKFKPGDPVVFANSAPCFDCFDCRRGRHNLCEHLDLLNGTYASYLKIPAQIVAHNTHKLSPSVSFEAAAFTEPLAVSLRCIEETGVFPGDCVAVLGLGAIGQLLMRLAKWKGAHVTALGRNPFRRQLAEDFALADVVVDVRQFRGTADLLQALTPEGRGFDVVIEAVGLPETWEQAIAMVSRGGRVNLFGGCPSDTTVPLDTRRLHYDEITLLSMFHHTPVYVKKALDLITDGVIDPTPLITTRMPMSQVSEALEMVEAGQALKVALTPEAAYE